MAIADLMVEHGTSDGRPYVIFRERSRGRPIVYYLASCRGYGDVIAQAYLADHGRADHGRWYFVRADGGTSSPGFDGPWLGWLLDLAREHGWEP